MLPMLMSTMSRKTTTRELPVPAETPDPIFTDWDARLRIFAIHIISRIIPVVIPAIVPVTRASLRLRRSARESHDAKIPPPSKTRITIRGKPTPQSATTAGFVSAYLLMEKYLSRSVFTSTRRIITSPPIAPAMRPARVIAFISLLSAYDTDDSCDHHPGAAHI
jgi:hypothetical protein